MTDTVEFQGQTYDVVEWARTHQGIVLRAYGPRPQFFPSAKSVPRFQVGDWVLRYDHPWRVDGLVNPETIRLSYGTRHTVLASASKCVPYQSRRGLYRLVGFRGADLLAEDIRSPLTKYTFTRAEWEAL